MGSRGRQTLGMPTGVSVTSTSTPENDPSGEDPDPSAPNNHFPPPSLQSSRRQTAPSQALKILPVSSPVTNPPTARKGVNRGRGGGGGGQAWQGRGCKQDKVGCIPDTPVAQRRSRKEGRWNKAPVHAMPDLMGAACFCSPLYLLRRHALRVLLIYLTPLSYSLLLRKL